MAMIEKEVRRMKQISKIRKAGICVIFMVFMMAAFSGCDWARELSEEFEEEKVLAAAEEVIDAMNDSDFDKIESMVSEEFRDTINADMLEDALAEKMSELGKFDSYKDQAAVGMKSKDYDGEVAVAIMNTVYEYGTMAVTISYNTDYEIIGFYVK